MRNGADASKRGHAVCRREWRPRHDIGRSSAGPGKAFGSFRATRVVRGLPVSELVGDLHRTRDRYPDLSRRGRSHPVPAALAPPLHRVRRPPGRWRTLPAACGVALGRPTVSLAFLAMMLRELWRRPPTFA